MQCCHIIARSRFERWHHSTGRGVNERARFPLSILSQGRNERQNEGKSNSQVRQMQSNNVE